MTVLLKKLEIHGFKSFASPTTFVFDRGITAIIGPNGSGKSNVSEALRWVLGEQQYSNLRGRRTEDIIFSGSDRRSQMGMAEVVLTLDNADGDLPLEFSEIVIARRAYRSGESQYLINGSKVRLRDIQQLTAPLGQAHTIIGQGLVDAVLSQRPEDRRGLFEHAAGIAGLRLRSNEATRSLGETAGNAQRLRDILAELAPRVRSLERSVRQAREYGEIRDRLQGLQRQYYGALWRDSTAKINRAGDALAAADQHLTDAEATHQRHAQRLAQLRNEERRAVALQEEQAEQLAIRERELAATRHRHDLLSAELRATTTRLADLERSSEELASRQEHARQESAELSETIDNLRNELESRAAELERQESAARLLGKKRAQREQQRATLEQQVLQLSRSIAEAEGRLLSFSTRTTSLEAEQTAIRQQISGEADRLRQLQHAQTDLESRLTAAKNARQAAIDAREEHLRMLDTLQQTERRNREALDTFNHELGKLRSRLEILERTWESGEGLHAGVRTVLRAVRRGQLDVPGLRGTLAELIDVPGDYETAIEVALGGHLQDLIVDRWADAELAINFLKRENAGRATFQPLDTLRRPHAPQLDVNDPGIIGIGAELIGYSPEIADVVGQALNRVLVVEDLAASRRIIKQSRNWTLVTLAGEITRPSGSVTGGSAARAAGLLTRERDRRALPARIESAEQQAAGTRQQLEATTDEIAVVARQIATAEREAAGIETTIREITTDQERAARDLHAARQSTDQLQQRLDNLAGHEGDLGREQEALVEQIAGWTAARGQAQADHDRIAGQLVESRSTTDDLLATLRTEQAAANERLRSLQTALERSSREEEQSARLINQRQADIRQSRQTLATLEAERDAVAGSVSGLEEVIETEREAIQPLIAGRQEIVPKITAAERTLDTSIGTVREAERQRDRATLDLARCQDEQVFLRERIANDLELSDPSTLLDDAGEIGEEQEKEINRLRERLRRMSAVGEDVLEEHTTESERLAFLTSQLEDVEGAAASLREVLADLNRKMVTSFSSTFQDVAVEFEQTFKRLFGGGTARLNHRTEDDEPGGIDIVAQPPGKRLQGLTQLSGGERALTAVALLVAIQRVNPSPFCLLDEVDAALDESNVLRFKDELRDLAGSTQFVVITHNRGTIMGADTLYGVSMGDDGVSRTISLKLDEAIRAVEEQEATAAG